jgi:hypothetical protein
MSLNIDDFGKFKIVQDDGNWVDKNRFTSVIDYWANYFNTMSVSGTIIHKAGDQTNVKYDLSKKLIVIKGHTGINTLAIIFAAAKCGHTLYFDNANNLTKAWYKKVKPDVLMVGDGDMCLEGGRYTSGEGCVRLLFTRRFEGMLHRYIYPNKKVSGTHTLIHHKDKKDRKFTLSKLSKSISSHESMPAVAYIENDTKHQVDQLVDTILPLMYSGAKIVLHTNISNFDQRQALKEHRPDVVYWGEGILKMVEDKEKFLNELVPAPLFVPHIRKTKKVKESKSK